MLQWKCIDIASGPKIAYHAGAVAGDYLYVHGGLSTQGVRSQLPVNQLFRIQLTPTVGDWTDLTTTDSPYLSQHQCINFNNILLIFVGGWTGRNRTPGLQFFNLQSGTWLPAAQTPPELQGFPQNAGLSAHTILPFETTRTPNRFFSLVLGREGSTRIQRRYGNAYFLDGCFTNVPGKEGAPQGVVSSSRPHFTYSEAPSPFHTESRSYHTSVAVDGRRVVIVGGRSSTAVEVLSLKPASGLPPLAFTKSASKAVSNCVKGISSRRRSLKPLINPQQVGWRGHYVVPGKDGFLIGGGEGFNALIKVPLDSVYLHLSNDVGTLYNFGKFKDRRAYAVSVTSDVDGSTWLFGGLGVEQKPLSSLMKLEEFEGE